MDDRRFDEIARSLAAPRTRRGVLGAALALAAGVLGGRGADGQVSQVYCGNVVCGSDPGVCKPGCVCCGYSNGNSRCRPASQCTGPGFVIPPAASTTTTTTSTTTTTTVPTTTGAPTTTAAPTSTTTGSPTTTTTGNPTTTTTTTTTPAPGTCTVESDCFYLDEDCFFGRCNTTEGICFQQPNPAGCAPVDCMVNVNACPGRDHLCIREADPSQNGQACGDIGGFCCDGDCCIGDETCCGGICRSSISFQFDSDNCGRCGVKCLFGRICHNYQCVVDDGPM